MKRTLLASVIALFFSVAVGCSDDDDSSSSSSYNLNGVSYNAVDAGTLTHGTTSISGAGSIVFVDPNAGQGNHYSLSFTLEDAGSLTLTSNAANDLTAGISLMFSRSGTTLTAKIKNDSSEVDISSSFTDVDASGSLSFQSDFHNDESPTHILVWSGVTEFTEDNAKFNSEDGGEAPGQGAGNLWGLVLDKASVTAATVTEAKFEEE
ncbi:MAG: hypothetical protein HRU09_07730 [Oligoflexales bacterium]|nr:hypothetical protein [Oligoflexales bacterium]